MSTDRYVSPLIRALCKQRNAVYFLTGYEIPHMEKIMDRPCRDRKRTWPEYYAGADR